MVMPDYHDEHRMMQPDASVPVRELTATSNPSEYTTEQIVAEKIH
jgi:hypothetical protein